jgi:hypothetical protein
MSSDPHVSPPMMLDLLAAGSCPVLRSVQVELVCCNPTW